MDAAMVAAQSADAGPSGLSATARDFVPVVNPKVLNATFFTDTLPDIDSDSGIVGICAVPLERASPDDLGWYITDFLAFKSLLCGPDTHPKAQTWLAQCDVHAIVTESPNKYTHHKDGRVVTGAAKIGYYRSNKDKMREDNVEVVTSAEGMKAKFMSVVGEKSKMAKAIGAPLVIIMCGLTSIEQDIFFGTTDGTHLCTIDEIRDVIPENLPVTVITPSPFSAGWQVNPSLCHTPVTDVRVTSASFLARQFGGLFAADFVDNFLDWKCPMIDDANMTDFERQNGFLGPLKPTDKQQLAAKQLRNKIHEFLIGRCSVGHKDHHFNFDTDKDQWVQLFGPRKYRSLDVYKQKWVNLNEPTEIPVNQAGLAFLGSAFGGTRLSQINHIKHLIRESFEAWPGYWALGFGQNVKKTFENFLTTEGHDDLAYHEIFNILEHRASSAVFGDMVVLYFDLPKPDNKRCRDWDELKEDDKASEPQKQNAYTVYRELTKHNIPAPKLPPGILPNFTKAYQRRLETPMSYVASSLHDHYSGLTDRLAREIHRIHDFLRHVKMAQAELLVSDPGVRQMCINWLNAIQMPHCEPDTAKIRAAAFAATLTIHGFDYSDVMPEATTESATVVEAATETADHQSADEPVVSHEVGMTTEAPESPIPVTDPDQQETSSIQAGTNDTTVGARELSGYGTQVRDFGQDQSHGVKDLGAQAVNTDERDVSELLIKAVIQADLVHKKIAITPVEKLSGVLEEYKLAKQALEALEHEAAQGANIVVKEEKTKTSSIGPKHASPVTPKAVDTSDTLAQSHPPLEKDVEKVEPAPWVPPHLRPGPGGKALEMETANNTANTANISHQKPEDGFAKVDENIAVSIPLTPVQDKKDLPSEEATYLNLRSKSDVNDKVDMVVERSASLGHPVKIDPPTTPPSEAYVLPHLRRM